jgi:SAM-dependent methyltransferase
MHYSAEYDNTQVSSLVFQEYVEQLAAYLITRYALKGKTIVEVGCGKGTFLRLLCRGGQNRGLGYDPSYVGPEVMEGGTLRFVKSLYTGQDDSPPPDLVVCRHVLEHLPDPRGMLAAIRRAVGERSHAGVFFEVPDVTWIFEQCAFWDFFYEHCSYFAPETLTWAFERAGFEVAVVQKSFSGQYLWLEARTVNRRTGTAPAPAQPIELERRLRTFLVGIEARTSACLGRIREYQAAGGCAVWGAAAKGTTLLNLLDPQGKHVDYAVDLNPAKQGGYIPGTGHPIVAPDHLRESPVAGILLMNPNYRDEVLHLLDRRGVRTPLECA